VGTGEHRLREEQISVSFFKGIETCLAIEVIGMKEP